MAEIRNGGNRVAVVQMSYDSGGRDTTVDKALGFIDEAASQGAKLTVLPEVFNMRYSALVGKYDTKVFDLAETIPGPTISKVAAKAKQHNMHIVAPIFERVGAGEYYDTAALIDGKGEVAGKYRKTHIPGQDIWLEKFYFRPGSKYPVFRTGVGNLGMLVCWDRHFPENWRTLTLGGAEVIVVPSAVPRKDTDTVEYVTKTRALENGVYAVMACRPDSEEGIDYTGSSVIVSPRGEVLAKAGVEEESVISAEIDLREVERARREWPFLRDLRTELFYKDGSG